MFRMSVQIPETNDEHFHGAFPFLRRSMACGICDDPLTKIFRHYILDVCKKAQKEEV
jgi:hypothetical protein